MGTSTGVACPRCKWRATPGSGASFCTPKSGSISPKVNAYDESLLDNPENKFFEPVLKKFRVRREALPLQPPGFQRFGPPVFYQLRHGGSSHEVFIAFRDVTGCRKAAAKAVSVEHNVASWQPASDNSSKRSLFKNCGSQRPVDRSWRSCCRLTADDKRIMLLMGSGAAWMARQLKRRTAFARSLLAAALRPSVL